MFLAGEARRDAVRRGALVQQLLRRQSPWHGAAWQPAALLGCRRRRHAARQGAGGAGGAAVRGAAAPPLGRRQGAQTPGADADVRRAARGAAGAAVRPADGGHAQRLPPHAAAGAAGPPPQRQLPGGRAAGGRQEVPAPRQPAQRLALGLQSYKETREFPELKSVLLSGILSILDLLGTSGEFHMIPQDILNTFQKHTVCAKAASWGSLVRRIFTSAAPLCTCQQSSCVAPPLVLEVATCTRKIMSPFQWAALVYLSKKKRLKV